VDSTLLLAEATHVLGAERVLAVIADSSSLPRSALAAALDSAAAIGVRVEILKTTEFDNPDYRANPPNRCYFCKAALFSALDLMARQRGFPVLAYGENADDMLHDRPGRVAASEYHVIAPLRDVGLSKAEIRERSRQLGLPTADQPAQPCLSSRIPWGTPVSESALAMVEAGEAWVRSLGFRIFRVRHLVSGDAGTAHASVEIAPEELEHAHALFSTVRDGLLAIGYHGATLKSEGYRGAGQT
jgi:uncharacterized protein